MDIEKITQILKEFKDNTSGIQGVALLGKESLLITQSPIGDWDKACAIEIAGVMDHLTKRITKQLLWTPEQHICVKAENGYIIRVPCGSDMFLLVKASNSDIYGQGFLEVAINNIVKELQDAISSNSPNKEENKEEEYQGRW
ncbi:MAG: hypothetical protein F6K58_12275 [Symploca sp. SIO2E9]|nr:hypothetical protein [Symploca sp. SIO2E9]